MCVCVGGFVCVCVRVCAILFIKKGEHFFIEQAMYIKKGELCFFIEQAM